MAIRDRRKFFLPNQLVVPGEYERPIVVVDEKGTVTSIRTGPEPSGDATSINGVPVSGPFNDGDIPVFQQENNAIVFMQPYPRISSNIGFRIQVGI